MAFLPQADDGHVDAALDCGNVGQALAANGGGATDLGGAGNLRHRLGMAHGLARVRLDGDDELALQGSDKRMHGELLSVQEEGNGSEQRRVAAEGTNEDGGVRDGRHRGGREAFAQGVPPDIPGAGHGSGEDDDGRVHAVD